LVGYFGNQNIRISPSDLVGTITLNASNITTGTLADARLSSNVALKNIDNNFSTQTINGILNISNNSNPAVNIKDSGQLGTAATPYFRFQDSGNTSIGLIGFISGSSGTFQISNQKSGGSILLDNDTTINGDLTVNGIPQVNTNQPILQSWTRSSNLIRLELSAAASSGYGFYDGAAGQYDVWIQNSKVGIKKTDPAVELDVDGEIRASNGILFGTDTAAANALDDYEEGTFTPVLTGSTSGTLNGTGIYTKIGDVVNISIKFIVTTANKPIGDYTITGLPFTSKATNPDFITFNYQFARFTFDSSKVIMVNLPASSTTISLTEMGSNNLGAEISDSNFVNAGNMFFRVNGSYFSS
jgi:hypothetical protein